MTADVASEAVQLFVEIEQRARKLQEIIPDERDRERFRTSTILMVAAQAAQIIASEHPDRPRSQSLRCTFCSRHANEVKQLVAGPTAFICDECVDICRQMIER